MWFSTVVLGVVFSCYQVLGGEVPDVTTIYEIGAEISSSVHGTNCINGVTGHIHARTNALGLGFIDEENYYFDSYNPDLPNITCDANFYFKGGCTQDYITSGTKVKWLDIPNSGIPIENGTAYKIRGDIVLNIENLQTPKHIIFTQGPGSLRSEKIVFVFTFDRNSRNYLTFYYPCDHGERYSQYHIDALDRDGSTTRIYCYDYYGNYRDHYSYSSSHNYLIFNFTANGGRDVHVYSSDSMTSKSLFIHRSYDTLIDVNYFSITTKDVKDANSVSYHLKALDFPDGEMVSPLFTPQTDTLCLSLLFHSQSSVIFPFPALEISSVGLVSNDAHLLNTISNVKSGWNVRNINLLLTNLNPIKLKIRNVGQSEINIARIASCNPDGEEVLELPSLISVCPRDRTQQPLNPQNTSLSTYSTVRDIFDPVEKINDTNNKCWNGGVLTSAGCACPPGFVGSNCDIGCGRNKFGQDCEGLCSPHRQECRGLLMCTRFTGCKCAPGYSGNDCTQECVPGQYGSDCSQRCGHCAGDSACDIYTGECASCEEGYIAPYCKLASVYYGSKPEVTSPNYGTIVVSFDPDNYVTVQKPPQLYQIQIKEKEDEWQVYTTKSLQKIDLPEKERNISEKIEGLKTGFIYKVRVLLMDDDLLKYSGDLVQEAEVLSKCDIPSFYDYKVTSAANTSSITFSWRNAIEDENTCPLETFEVAWKARWTWQRMYTSQDFTLTGLWPGAMIKFKVRGKTTGGFLPYSKMLLASTQKTDLPSVQNIQVESRQSTSVKISWEPRRGTGEKQLRYTISYKCVDRPACSPGCQNVTEGKMTQEETRITLSPLVPFTKYLVTISAEGGDESSIYVATTKVVPLEVPILSTQKPVRTNTSVTVYWDQGPVCTGYLLGYNYQLTTASDPLNILASGFTKGTNASFHNLTATTEYVVKVFVSTVAGWNPLSYLAINVSTSDTVPEAVRNLIVYKRGRGMLGLRWAEPRATYGQLKSFTVTHSLGQEVTSHTVEPSHCVVWPDLYCHTIEGLRSNRRYNVSVSARNSEVSEDGELVFASAVTKESSPSAPVNLKVTNSTSTSIELGWNYPEMANGIVRSFLLSVEETEKYDQDSCCQIYPIVETSVKEELETYSSEVSGLHPASTYYVSISAKTVGLGPSQSLVAYTRPPHLPLTLLPRLENTETSWLPQDKLPEVNNSEVYTSLIKAHLLLAVLNEAHPDQVASESGITDPKLDSFLQQRIGKPFYFIAEYNQDNVVELGGPLEDSESTWGQPLELSPEVSYQLIAIQVLEYNSVYNVDLRYSQPFSLT